MTEAFQTFILRCACHSLEHIAVFDYDKTDGTLYLTIHLQTHRFLKRLWIGIKYIFGYQSRLGAFEEIIIPPAKCPQIKEILTLCESHRCTTGMGDEE